MNPKRGANNKDSAELLRRFEHSRWVASRTTAGPAAPPSWHAATRLASRPKSTTQITQDYPPVTTTQLEEASSLFTHRPRQRKKPVPRLLDFCFYVFLKHVDDESVIYVPEYGEAIEQQANETYTMSRLLREQVAYLEPHLKTDLIDAASLLPEASKHISDRSYKAILYNLPPDVSDERDDAHESDWDTPDLDFHLTHLPLTLHPSPLTFFRSIPSISSLTSINIAYSIIPDLEGLVDILPKGLRELGLAGISIKKGEDSVKKGFIRLARKLIVLKVSNYQRSMCYKNSYQGSIGTGPFAPAFPSSHLHIYNVSPPSRDKLAFTQKIRYARLSIATNDRIVWHISPSWFNGRRSPSRKRGKARDRKYCQKRREDEMG